MFVLKSAVLSEEMVLLAVDNAELVEVDSEVTLPVVVESELFVLARLLVTVERPLLVELDSAVTMLFALESEPPIAVLKIGSTTLATVSI
jgi:hypothetical protein